MIAIEISKQFSASSLIRQIPGKESMNFLRIFHNELVVHLGPHPTQSPPLPSRVGLYHVRGRGEGNKEAVVAVELEISAKFLNTRDIFFLV